MNAKLKELIDSNFRTIEAKDLEATLAGMTDDIELFDPHYPKPLMNGKADVAYGLGWAFKDLLSLGFHVDRYFFTDDDTGAAVEVSCEHELKVGGKLNFNQVFTMEFRDGLISKFTAYEPYGPSGTSGFGLKVAHFFYKLENRKAARASKK